MKELAIRINSRRQLTVFRNKFNRVGGKWWFMPHCPELMDLKFLRLPCLLALHPIDKSISGWADGDSDYFVKVGLREINMHCFLLDIFPNFEVEGLK